MEATTETIRKTAIVTGASRGIGAETARELSRAGMNVVIVYRSGEEKANAVKCECEKNGVTAITVQADVSQEDDCKKIIEAALDAFGRVDVLVNNAGQTKDGLAMRMTKEQFTSVLDVNLVGAWQLSSLVLKPMSKQKGGRIINLSSVAGIYGNAGQTNYAASKAGIIGFSKSLAKEMGSRGITVNCVAPGFVETDMTDALSDAVKENICGHIALKRTGKPEDIAKCIAFLASDDASYITGQVIEVSGGLSM
ncbi:MAG TPA: 3-oxoacyl-[acyl-carrier-protein] reductase [Bacillota bacterium]|nr:3-oxoacyl-[acyl-carrier-protein] reductase [Bacillota bacterium]